MILREQEEEQQPKLRDDRALLPTRRYGSSSNHDPEAQRPTSPAPTVLPDYETSQAQFYSGILTSVQKSTKSFARSRCFRILWRKRGSKTLCASWFYAGTGGDVNFPELHGLHVLLTCGVLDTVARISEWLAVLG